MTTLRATYRLQIQPDFDLDAAVEVVDYLRELGVSHVYSSPLLASAPGSTHGYDVIDPTVVDPQRGGEDGFRRLVDATRAADLGIVLDIVPNHVAVLTAANRWWWDLLEHGQSSRYARVFDIDWDAGEPDAEHGRVVVPVLGDGLDRVVAAGEITVGVGDDGAPAITYFEHIFPLAPGSLDAAGGRESVSADPERLRALLDAQHYRLAEWRSGSDELNYRRFFDVKELGGVRIEDPEVFALTHERILEMVESGDIDGLRVDHPDGLRDPARYFRRLRAAASDAWIVVEKIIEPGEQPREGWAVDGTVGYELAHCLQGLFVDPTAEGPLTDFYDTLTGHRDAAGHRDLHVEVEAGKRDVVAHLLVAECRRLGQLFAAVADEAGFAASAEDCERLVAEAVIAFPVYRTYVVPEAGTVSVEDRAVVDRTLATVLARIGKSLSSAPDVTGRRDTRLLDLLELLGDVLVLDRETPSSVEFVARLQQLTGPAMAKGVEDTAFYRYLRFAALNEVGGDPGHFGCHTLDFHAANQLRQRDWPAAMITTSTHDTKRSEDVRSRLATLTEIPARWIATVSSWRDACAELRGEHGPSANMEYLAYQTVVGAWPIDADRLTAYLRKAAREEKRDTSWLDPNEDYEADLERFATRLVDHEPFLDLLEMLLDTVVPAGRITALAHTLLKLTSPGVPDIYQGCELWDLSLVDPDNRRPVDYAVRRRLLRRLDGRDGAEGQVDTAEILASMDEGLPKLWVTRQALTVAARHPESFGVGGDYRPLLAAGHRSERVVAFLRGEDVMTIAPRLVTGLGERFGSWDWRDTTLELPSGEWINVFSGRHHDGGPAAMASLLEDFPVALLERRTGS